MSGRRHVFDACYSRQPQGTQKRLVFDFTGFWNDVERVDLKSEKNRLSQNVDFRAAHGIGITSTAGLAEFGRQSCQIGAIGANGADCGYGAVLAGIGHGHSAATLATRPTRKALHGDRAVRLNAHIHSPTIGGSVHLWQGGLPDA